MARNWQWLDGLTTEDVANKLIPFKQLLEDSVYYPASGTDGAPVQYLHHLSRTFIYVDYNYSLERLKSEMLNHGFMGYEIFAERLVREHEITPKNFRPHEFPSKEDGDPRKPFDGGWVHQPSYAYWTIWQRTADFGEEHGPIRFSLFNLCADGVASFDALYYTWETKPLVFRIIRPGTGYGLNWTDFRKPGQIMHRLAMNNPAGAPEYMLMEKRLESEDDQGCYWPEYSTVVEVFEHNQLLGENMSSELTKNDGIKFFARITFGSADFENYIHLCVNRAYGDFARTIHGIGDLLDDERAELRNYAESAISTFATKILTDILSENEFDKLHREVSDKLVTNFKTEHANIQFHTGTAQKWINMTLKYLYMLYLTDLIYLNESEKKCLKYNYAFFHLPIDDIVKANDKFLKETYKNMFGNDIRWSRIVDYESYLEFQKEIRSMGVVPLDYEFNIWLNG